MVKLLKNFAKATLGLLLGVTSPQTTLAADSASLHPDDQAVLDSIYTARKGNRGVVAESKGGRITKLQIFPFDALQAWSLPPGVAELPELTELLVRCEKMSQPLPEKLFRHPVLQELLIGNYAWPLPEQLGDLTNLKDLRLLECNFASLPESLGSLKKLYHLYVYSGKLTSLPESLGELENLKFLDIRKTPLTQLPESLGKLVQLQDLRITNARLSALPQSFGKLKNLENCDFEGNKLESFPADLSGLVALTQLDLCKNNLKTLPGGLAALPKLEKLNLHGNRLSGPVPEFFFQFPQLEYLNLSGNDFSGPLPAQVATAPNLKTLVLTANSGLNGALPPLLSTEKMKMVATYETALTNATQDEALFRAQWDSIQSGATRLQEEEDDSDVEGPVLKLFGIATPVRLEENTYSFTSSGRHITMWGAPRHFFIDVDMRANLMGLDMDKVLPAVEALGPVVSRELERLAAMDPAALILAAAHHAWPTAENYIRYGSLEDWGEPPIRNAAELAKHLYISTIAINLNEPLDNPEIKLGVNLLSYEFVFGGHEVGVSIKKDGTIDFEGM